MSGYQRINFKDQNVERPKTYDVTNNPDGSITLIESFGNVEELGTPINKENMNHIEDGIDAVSFSKFSLDLTYKKDDLVTDIQDDELKIFKSLKDNNFGHLPSESEYWEEVEISGGGGLEIGDIGIAPLGIDETRGKRRYLNGQIIVQDQYTIFSEKVKNAINLYPTLGCTEQEWQTIATMSVGGQVGKFVVDNEGGTIRLPKIIMPIQGLTDLSKLAQIVDAGLPNITGSMGQGNNFGLSGAFYQGSGRGFTFNDNTAANVKFSASRSSSIYGKSSTVQQEQIQYPYFIQVATGSETEDNIVNTLELNNPFVLLEPKFFEAEVYNVSWLIANGTYNGSNAVHPSAYQALLVENNAEVAIGSTVTLPIGTEYTKRGLSVKLSTDSDITDYDFVVNTTDETFRLPIKVNLASGRAVVGNGKGLLLTNGTASSWITNDAEGSTNALATSSAGVTSALNIGTNLGTARADKFGTTVVGVTPDPTKSGLELSDSNLYLYFYVGETVQNANLINAGRIEEKVASLIPDNSSLIASYSVPATTEFVSLTWNTAHQLPCDAIIVWGGYSASASDDVKVQFSYDNVTWYSYTEFDSGYIYTSGYALQKGVYIKGTGGNSYQSLGYIPLKGVN